jgi:protease I
MASKELDGLRVAILATDGFEQSELVSPRKALDRAGARTTVVSPGGETIRGWTKGDWGDEVDVDLALDDAEAEEFDALLLPGGVMNPDKLRRETKAVELVRAFLDAGKPVAAICHGPWMLVEADGVRGREVTSYASIRTDLVNAGAKWKDAEVVIDGNLVTSRKPDDLPAFERGMVETFGRAVASGRR